MRYSVLNPALYIVRHAKIWRGMACLLAYPVCICSQAAQAPAGTRAAGMGNITVTLIDAWSTVNNPAGLGILTNAAVSVSHEQRFSMKEMGISSIVGVFQLWGNSIGVSFGNTGNSNFGENFFGIATGRKLNEFISAGVSINGRLLYFSHEYRNLFAINGQAGIWARLTKNMTLGFCVTNMTFSKWNNEERTPLPVVFALGVGYSVTKSIQLCIEAYKDIYEALRLKAGTEFCLVQTLYLRVGIVSAPFEPHFGIGYIFKKWKLDAAISRHPFLGYTPYGGVNFEF